jgi:ferredoxin/flavodoxin---NADP+ reductase
VTHECDILIIGAGPAGLYAAYYAGFRGWSVVVMDALPEAGGQITAMYPEKDIFDVAGYPTVKGRELVENLLASAAPYSPTYVLGEQATSLTTSDDEPAVVVGSNGTTVRAKAVIITGGIGSFTPRALPADDGWEGRGLVYFVPRLADHADRDIVIVGGGDSAFDWAYSLAPIARSVALVHRREQFRAHGSMVDTVRDMGVRLFTSSQVTAIRGGAVIEEVEVTHKETGEQTVLPAQTVVAALGFVANIGPIAQWGLELAKRHLMVDTAMRTNLPRVFAAGDITTYEGKVPLISVGFGEAALAVNNAAPIVEPGMGIFPGHSSGGSAE